MKATEIKKGVYWVGGIDWDIREFHGYLTQKGTTYNAYLIVDEKVVLVDTVKHYLFEEMLERIKDVIDPSKIDYIVSNHAEMDHSGSLLKILKHCVNAEVIASENGKKILEAHFGEIPKLKTVKAGDTLNIGQDSLHFVPTQMVHWPDSMVTYMPGKKLLLSNDAFGQHIASKERFDDEVGWDTVLGEAAKYYANIVMPYGAQVSKALGAVGTLEIDMVAPSHGVIWRTHIKEILEEYTKWSNNDTQKKAVIVYDTMWESTKSIAESVRKAFTKKKIPVCMMDLGKNDISDIITHVLEAEYICVGSPTLNNNLMPKVSAFLTYLKGLAPKKRKAMAFGSYGWGGQSISQVEEILKSCGFDMLSSVKAQYVPTKERLEEIRDTVESNL